jgi:hypothetical protein
MKRLKYVKSVTRKNLSHNIVYTDELQEIRVHVIVSVRNVLSYSRTLPIHYEKQPRHTKVRVLVVARKSLILF